MLHEYSSIEQACKDLIDFIGSCRGGDSYLKTPDGGILTTDWGYVREGLLLLYGWAEKMREIEDASKQ